jgi:thiamine-phosphate pyrophosphorylase
MFPSASSLHPPILCYVTDRKALSPIGSRSVGDSIRLAAGAGVDWIQIREKDISARELLALTQGAIRDAYATSTGVRILLNDRLDIALAAGAAGVHLGGESAAIPDVVRWCRGGNAPPEFLIGVSCHRMEEAIEAERAGASYAFFGPVYETPSKRSFGPPQGIDRLRSVCRAVRFPVMAIGGLSEENTAEALKAGAAGIAAIRLFQQSKDVTSLKQLVERLRQNRSNSSATR